MTEQDEMRNQAHSGWGFLLVFVVLTGTAGYLYTSTDPTPGLGHQSGDRAQEMRRAICATDGAGCPPSGLNWTIPAAGAVETRLELDDPGRTELTGRMSLRATDCDAAVDWSITVDGGLIQRDTLRAGGDDQPVVGTPPPGSRVLIVTARRTDGESCPVVFQWLSAGLV